MTLIQTEPKKIYMGGKITDMQGPCPSGFHVPTKDGWGLVKTRLTELGIDTSNGNCCKIYLKMPFAGIRYYDNAANAAQGSNGYYWSSSPKSDNRYAYVLIFGSSQFSETNMFRSNGEMIRPFKDTSVIPTSSWTTLFDGSSIAAGAGIFHNTTDGLISISSDGQNRITIADKNLGATVVYNDGDTLSETNCGKYYQWGNNYGFAWTGTVTTSSTQVDASNYGPGNYYSSSTFITTSSSPYDRSSVQNDNLRGGVGTKEIKKVYLGSTQVRPKIPPYLCFTANTAGSKVTLGKSGNPTSLSFEISTDNQSWSSYTQGSWITLSNIGDKVYFRNTSDSNTSFNLGNGNCYNFSMQGSIAASGDVTTLVNKKGLSTIGDYCFNMLFGNCTSLTSAPSLPYTEIGNYCYKEMFYGCSNLETLPKLPATTLKNYCYQSMFQGCSKIKLSTTQTGAYQTPYKIPFTGTGTAGTNSLSSMFSGTGGSWYGTPNINTTYYTSNTVV